MTPDLVILLINVLLKYGPGVYMAVKGILQKTTVTPEDFAALDALLEKTGASYFK